MAQERMDRVLGIAEPPDGFTPEEKMILQLAGTKTITDIYGMLPTWQLRALVALHYELGYSQEMLSEIAGNMTQEWISMQLELVRKILMGKSDRSKHGRPYQPKPKKQTPKLEDLLKLAMMLAEK